MSDCVNAEVKDALPDLLNGRLSELDTATMNAHVESCADCRAELAVLREAKSTAMLAPRIDVARIAAAIPAYGGSAVFDAPSRRPFLSRMNTLRIAAVAAVVAIGGFVFSSRSTGDVVPGNEVAAVAPVVETKTVPQTASGNATTPAPVTETRVATLSLVGSTSELSDEDLEKLVSELDGIETLPAAEPQSVTTTVEEIGSNEDSGL